MELYGENSSRTVGSPSFFQFLLTDHSCILRVRPISPPALEKITSGIHEDYMQDNPHLAHLDRLMVPTDSQSSAALDEDPKSPGDLL